MPDDINRELISGGRLIAKAPRAEGAEVAHIRCDGRIRDLYDGCVDEGIEVVHLRRDQAATRAADGHARITGSPGCALVTAGPGTTDALSAVATAFRVQAPLLLIGGQGALTRASWGAPPGLPHTDMTAPLTKSAASVPNAAHAAEMVSAALRACYRAEPGPSFLETPDHVLATEVPSATVRIPGAGHRRAPTRPAGDPEATGQIGLDTQAVGEHRDIGLGFAGDAGLVLRSVAEAASGRADDGACRRKEWLDELRATEETALGRRLPQLRSDALPIHPYRRPRRHRPRSAARPRVRDALVAQRPGGPARVRSPQPEPAHGQVVRSA
ncbi:thiamine pyrophosphate-binding protein [Streptomyces chiangmaiensis]|uniref:Thiamine pyrophosphate-binding protein n=1 Tax=Streptomyces chiangmaiensis TaxID=766497 RepID=A0ABU7FR41_9ACTN|nr:thiamine pyrophosphate-binding protein [Streptomyces chiangmaiensis]MED7826298.1 thiamine pyrophosphate-binding protein [Streptomyces chiangmaiensis]